MFYRVLVLAPILIFYLLTTPGDAAEIKFLMEKTIFLVNQAVDARLVNGLDKTVLIVYPNSCRHSLEKLENGQWRILHLRRFLCWQTISYQAFEPGTARDYSYSPKAIAELTENQPTGTYRIFVRIAESKRSKSQTVTSPAFQILE